MCAHCDYEYPPVASTAGEMLAEVALFVISLWLFMTLVFWGVGTALCVSPDAAQSYNRCYPLTHYLAAPVRWARKADVW